MTICYDLRFPGLFQALREQGAEIISVPAAFTRYRASIGAVITCPCDRNQCYILAPAKSVCTAHVAHGGTALRLMGG